MGKKPPPELDMRKIARRIALTLTLFLTVGSQSSIASSRQTGIEGNAFLIISYGTMVHIEDGIGVGVPSIQLPTATAFTVFSSKGHREMGRIITDPSGHFSAALHPGRYVLVPDNLTTFGCSVSLEPIEVTVDAKELTTMNVFYFQDGPCWIMGTIVPEGPQP
jgi:hypothetical protein